MGSYKMSYSLTKKDKWNQFWKVQKQKKNSIPFLSHNVSCDSHSTRVFYKKSKESSWNSSSLLFSYHSMFQHRQLLSHAVEDAGLQDNLNIRLLLFHSLNLRLANTHVTSRWSISTTAPFTSTQGSQKATRLRVRLRLRDVCKKFVWVTAVRVRSAGWSGNNFNKSGQ